MPRRFAFGRPDARDVVQGGGEDEVPQEVGAPPWRTCYVLQSENANLRLSCAWLLCGKWEPDESGDGQANET